MKPYKTLLKAASEEFIVNKSRFIGHGAPCETEEEALAFLGRMREQYKDANHNCYAYIIGANMGVMRYNDDGEPGGTAGMPIIEVMKARGVTNCAVVVTRYFGGTLLGTGGLIRAYGGAAKDAVENAGISEKMKGIMAETVVEYTDLGKLEYLLRENQVTTLDTGYTDKVELTLLIPAKDESRIRELLTEESGGRITLGEGMEVAYIETKNGPKVL